MEWGVAISRTKLVGEGSWEMGYLEYAFGCLSLYTMPFGTRVLKHNPESQKWPRVWAFCCFYLILGPVLLWEVAGEPVSANNLILDPVGAVTASFRKSQTNVNRNGKQFLSSLGNKLASIRCVFDSCQKIWGSLTLELRAAIASVWLLVVTKVRVNHLLLTTHSLS